MFRVGYGWQIRESQENVNLQDQRNSDEGPPQPPRSAFICFTDAKREEVVRSHGLKNKDDILKILAEEWRRLSHSERAYWDEEARNDKVRYVVRCGIPAFSCVRSGSSVSPPQQVRARKVRVQRSVGGPQTASQEAPAGAQETDERLSQVLAEAPIHGQGTEP